MNEYEQEREEEEERRVQADVLMEGQTRTGMGRAGYVYQTSDPREQAIHITHAIGAMLNAEVTLQSVYDCDGVPGTLQRQARRDAKALTEAIALLRERP